MFSNTPHPRHRLSLAGCVLLIGLLLQSECAIAQPNTVPDDAHHAFSLMLSVGYSRSAFNRSSSYAGIARTTSPQFGAQFDYRFYSHLGVSGAMNLLGSTEFRGVRQADGQMKQSGELSSMSAEVALVGYLPMTQKSTLYARAGGAYINVRQSQRTDGVPLTSHANGVSPLAGLGVELDLQRVLAFRVGVDWYINAGDAQRLGGEGDIQSAYCGFVFRFN